MPEYVRQPLTDIVPQDFCRLMYSHGSLHTEGIDVLTFIDDTFDQRSVAMGHNEDLYREHCVKVSTLPVVTDQVSIPHVVVTIALNNFLTQIKMIAEVVPTARKTSYNFSGEGDGHFGQHYTVATIVVGLRNRDL